MSFDESAPELLAASLRIFFRLAGEWDLSESEQSTLVGAPSPSILKRWRSGEVVFARAETLKRISYLIGIYAAIHALIPVPDRVNGWIRKENSAPLFGGASPLERMLSGEIADLRLVRRYLDAQLG